MFRHNIYKGKSKYRKNNNNIFLFIRKQPGEIDWILPVLFNLRNKFNIFTIFEKRISLKLIKENKILYNFFLDSVCYFFTNSIYKNFLLRTLQKFSQVIGFTLLNNFLIDKIFNKYYSVEELIYILKKRDFTVSLENTKILLQDFTDNSPWALKFFQKYNKAKIINYPHSTRIYSNKISRIRINNIDNFNIKNRSYLFLSRLSDTHFFKKRFTNIPICICGYPKYQSSWLRTISNNNKKVAASKKIIFVAYKGFNKKKYYKDKYLKQLHSLFDIAFRNNYKLVFKFHPNEQEEKVFLSVAQSYPKELYSITKDYLYDAAKKSDIFISFYNNASILDGLCANLTPIELSNIFLKKQVSLFTKFKLSLFCKNGTEIEKTIKNIIKKKINKKNIKKNFSKIIISKNAIQKTSDFISKISGL